LDEEGPAPGDGTHDGNEPDPFRPGAADAELSLGLHRPFDSSSSFHLFCKRLCMLWILKVNFPHDHTVLRRFERGE
jgi:hypothetical protein